MQFRALDAASLEDLDAKSVGQFWSHDTPFPSLGSPRVVLRRSYMFQGASEGLRKVAAKLSCSCSASFMIVSPTNHAPALSAVENQESLLPPVSCVQRRCCSRDTLLSCDITGPQTLTPGLVCR
jgi:hypothetical protein